MQSNGRAKSSIRMVQSERRLNSQSKIETRFYILSLSSHAHQHFAEAVRSHWRIKNGLHWLLDVAFAKDASRIRKYHKMRLPWLHYCLVFSIRFRKV